MTHASGRSAPADLVSAHKWFNIAAMKGHADAARMRREIAAEMTDAEIGQAQRAARDWLKSHAEAAARGSAIPRRGLTYLADHRPARSRRPRCA